MENALGPSQHKLSCPNPDVSCPDPPSQLRAAQHRVGALVRLDLSVSPRVSGPSRQAVGQADQGTGGQTGGVPLESPSPFVLCERRHEKEGLVRSGK